MLCCYGDVREHFDNMTLIPFMNKWQKKNDSVFSMFWDINSWLDNVRAYSSSLLYTIIARNHGPFFKIFSNFVHFPQIFKDFALLKKNILGVKKVLHYHETKFCTNTNSQQ